MDTLITGGRVVDGTGAEPFPATIGIERGRLVVLRGDAPSTPAKARIDASGLVVAPGFIDTLSHSYFTLLRDPTGLSKLAQGVTTSIEGENSGAVPMRRFARPWMKGRLAELEVEACFSDLDGYAARLEAEGLSANVGVTVAAGMLRASWVDAPADAIAPADFESLARELAELLDAGATGLTITLPEELGCAYSEEELEHLLGVVASRNALFSVHLRSEAEGVLAALDEVIGLVRRTGVRADILHFKVVGRESWPLMDLAIAKVEAARRAGLSIAASAYPYEHLSIAIQELLPGGAEIPAADRARRLRESAEERRATARALETFERSWMGHVHPGPSIWSRMLLAQGAHRGASVESVAAAAGSEVVPWLLRELAATDRWIICNGELVSAANLRQVLRRAWVGVCSDGSARSPGIESLRRGPVHPRDYGAFARVFRVLVREERLLTLPEAVRRMTSHAADRLGLHDRGRIRDGAIADLVLFDPQTVRDNATFEDPHQLATGVHDVFVNGELAFHDGAATAARAGRFTRVARGARRAGSRRA